MEVFTLPETKTETETDTPSVNKFTHSSFETQKRCHQKSKTRVSVAPTKGHVFTKNFNPLLMLPVVFKQNVNHMKGNSYSGLFWQLNHVFSILYWISLISRIRRIQLELVNHDQRLLENFSVSSTHSWLFDVIVMTPDLESVGCELK